MEQIMNGRMARKRQYENTLRRARLEPVWFDREEIRLVRSFIKKHKPDLPDFFVGQLFALIFRKVRYGFRRQEYYNRRGALLLSAFPGVTPESVSRMMNKIIMYLIKSGYMSAGSMEPLMAVWLKGMAPWIDAEYSGDESEREAFIRGVFRAADACLQEMLMAGELDNPDKIMVDPGAVQEHLITTLGALPDVSDDFLVAMNSSCFVSDTREDEELSSS